MTRLNSTSKYHNVKCELDGVTYASKAERRRAIELGLMKQAKAIRWFNRQPSFLLPGGIRYMPDFIVCDLTGKIFVEDVKSAGTITQVFRIKQKLWLETYPDIELRIVR